MSLSDWKARRDRPVTLPSGMRVTVRLPALQVLVKGGRVPDAIRPSAVRMLVKGGLVDDDKDPTVEQLSEFRSFQDWLVSVLVVDPSISPEDVAELPEDDRSELVAYALRLQRLPPIDDAKESKESDRVEVVADVTSFRSE